MKILQGCGARAGAGHIFPSGTDPMRDRAPGYRAAVLDPAYALRDGPPAAEVAVELRVRAGMTPKSLEQEALALAGSWAAAHVVEVASGHAVGMGRVISDGGWYFHIADMAVFPEHQRKGIGDAILRRLLERIWAGAAPGEPYITLMADEPGRPLYRKHGFVDASAVSLGMVLRTPRP
jgi:GNAT superfamily N-acetyltransferase